MRKIQWGSFAHLDNFPSKSQRPLFDNLESRLLALSQRSGYRCALTPNAKNARSAAKGQRRSRNPVRQKARPRTITTKTNWATGGAVSGIDTARQERGGVVLSVRLRCHTCSPCTLMKTNEIAANNTMNHPTASSHTKGNVSKNRAAHPSRICRICLYCRQSSTPDVPWYGTTDNSA